MCCISAATWIVDGWWFTFILCLPLFYPSTIISYNISWHSDYYSLCRLYRIFENDSLVLHLSSSLMTKYVIDAYSFQGNCAKSCHESVDFFNWFNFLHFPSKVPWDLGHGWEESLHAAWKRRKCFRCCHQAYKSFDNDWIWIWKVIVDIVLLSQFSIYV